MNQTLNPEDTGEVARIDDLGTDPTRDLSAARAQLIAERRDTTGEFTQNLAHEIAGLPPRRRPEAGPTTLLPLIDTPLGLSYVDLEGPQKPPPPLPKPKADPPETERLSLLGSVAGLDGDLYEDLDEPELEEDGDDVVFRRGCNGGEPFPVAAVVDRTPATLRDRWRRGRHATPVPFWTAFLIGVGVAIAGYSGVVLAAVWVMW